MSKYIKISNQSENVSRIALEKLGLSTKRNDPDTIGQFGSGIKFAPIAAIRKGMEFVFSGNDDKGSYNLSYIIKDDEVVPGEVDEISSETGLIGTPRRSEGFVEMDLVFEPRIQVGQMLRVSSRTEPTFNRVYKVTGLVHRGTMSPRVPSICTTTVTLLWGQAFMPLRG
jgi:hypothetical protein